MRETARGKTPAKEKLKKKKKKKGIRQELSFSEFFIPCFDDNPIYPCCKATRWLWARNMTLGGCPYEAEETFEPIWFVGAKDNLIKAKTFFGHWNFSFERKF